MVKLPKELFEPFGENRKYLFTNLDGEGTEIILGKNDFLSTQNVRLTGQLYYG